MSANYLLYSVWFLAGIALLSLILSRELSMVALLSILLIAPFLFYLERYGRLKKMQWLENSLVIFFFVFSLIRFFYFKANFLIAVAEFLISFLLIKLSFKKERKDFMQIIILSIFVFLSAATLATDFSFLLSFVFFAIALCAVLTLYSLTTPSPSSPSLRYFASQNPFGLKGREGGILSLHQEEIERGIILRYLLRNSAITLTLTVLFSISIFIFFPRLSLAVFQGTFLAPQQKSGFSDSVNLSGAGKIFEDASVAMRVEIPPPAFSAKGGYAISASVPNGTKSGGGKILPAVSTPTPRLRGDGAVFSHQGRGEINPLYLKGQTLAHFDGLRWTSGEKKAVWLVADSFRSRIMRAQKIVRNRFPILGEEKKSLLKKKFALKLGAGDTLTQKIYLESLEGAYLFAVPWVDELFVKAPQLSLAEDFTIRRQENFSGRAVYEVRSIVERPDEKKLLSQEKGSEKEEELQKYLQTPEMDFSRTKELLSKLVSKKDSAFIQAKKLEKFFKDGREGFQYSLENPVEKSSNPVEEFLFEAKQGHCEYFASAMALLLRMAGVPSRVATGFLAQEWNSDGNYFIVRGKDAHAWVEAYMGNGLWLEFDPSPRVRGEDLLRESYWALFKSKVDYLNFLWNSYVLGYDMESQKSLARNVELKSVQFSRELDSFFAKGRRWFRQTYHQWFQKQFAQGEKNIEPLGSSQMPNAEVPSALKHQLWVGGYLILLSLSIWFGIKLNYYFKNKRGWNPTVGFYKQMLDLLAKKGLKKLAAETPCEFAKRVLGKLALPKGGESIENGEPIQNGEVANAIDFLTLLFCKIRYSDYRPALSDLAEANRSLNSLKNSLKRLL